MGLGDSVWDRKHSLGMVRDELDKQTYIAAVSGFTVYGLVLAATIAFYTMGWKPDSIWLVLGIGLGLPLVGILIAVNSDEWPVSLLGYTMVVVGLGVITGPAVARYETGVVMNALAATAGVTVVTSLMGIAYPKSLEGMGGYLFGGLLALLFVRIAEMFMLGSGIAELPEGTNQLWGWIDYAAAVLFSVYIIYDWNRALRLPHTMDNAVDCALAIFLDILNLFLNLLRILRGGSSSSSK